MGLLSGGMEALSLGKVRRGSDASSVTSDRRGSASGGANAPPSGNPNDTTVLDKDEGNLLMALIAQLRPGMDLTKIQFPTFVLEPRSLLERITDFFSHPELIFGIGSNPDAKERFLAVLIYYLSGWHIKPKGVKKPYNPILGEIFRCTYTYDDGSEGFYVAEQVSHHPPISAFFYTSPKNGVLITGELKPKSRFLGNSAATIMEGENRIRLLQRPEDGDYSIGMPNMFARGILFGKMVLELGDTSTVACAANDYICDVEFKTKGWISGGYNAIAGHVKGPNHSNVGEITGHWSSSMEYKDTQTGKKTVCFDADNIKAVGKTVLPEEDQEENESRRLWSALTKSIKNSDMEAAQNAKSAVEDAQRDLAKKREASGTKWEPRFFVPQGEKWMPKLDIDRLPKDPEEMAKLVKDWIFSSPNKSSPTLKAVASPPPPSSAKATPAPSVKSQVSVVSTDSVPAIPTAPGPPAPGPKLNHPPA